MCRHIGILALMLLIAFVAFWTSAHAESEGAEPRWRRATPKGITEKVDQLINELADPKFTVREKATKALIDIGALSRKQLKAAATSDDPEVRYRAQYALEELPFSGWPDDLARRARALEKSESTDYELIRQIVQQQDKAMLFLMKLLASEVHAEQTSSILGNEGEAPLAYAILESSDEPTNDYQKEALIWALAYLDYNMEALRQAGGSDKAIDDIRLTVDAQAESLARELDAGEYKTVMATARECYTLTKDVRFAALAAEAERRAGRPEEAEQLPALLEHPTRPYPHELYYFLIKIDCDHLAAQVCEWELNRMKRDNDVAWCHMRLSQIYRRSGLLLKAAAHLQAVVDIVETTGQEDICSQTRRQLVDTIELLHRQAEHYPAPEGSGILHGVRQHLHVSLTEVVKGGRLAEFKKAEKDVRCCVGVHGLSWFGWYGKEIQLTYNPKEEMLTHRHSKARFDLRLNLAKYGEKANVQFEDNDKIQFAIIDTRTGEVTLLDSFQVDYLLKISPEGPLSGMKLLKGGVRSRDHSYHDREATLEELHDGLTLDKIVEDMEVWVEGVLPDGRLVELSRYVVPLLIKAENTDPPPAKASRTSSENGISPTGPQ